MDNFVAVVLVSHSHALASAAADLVVRLAGEGVPVAYAGGTADRGLGTSPELVRAAIESVRGPAGVVVVPDLGSAVLTTRAVLDGLTPGGPVLLADAPFVEGALAAVATASVGGDLASVVAAAQEARDVPKL